MLHFPLGKWVPGKHKIFLESLLHMVHVLQSSQKLRLASKKSSIFSGAIFPTDVGEIRHPNVFLKWLLGPSWARLSFIKSILSRVGDRPTATILQAQFHFVDFCLVF